MSLVAYGASDDSEASDAEDNQVPNTDEKQVNDQISDDEEYQAVSSTSSKQTTALNSIISDDPLIPSSFSSQQDLPPPQRKEEVTVEETDLEDEVRQKPSELANAPKPPAKRTKQPVKITIPSLNEIADDDDDGAKTKKQPTPSATPSGLFALLPPPVHSAKKEINRPLIPHSLARKPPSAKPVIQAPSVSSSTQKSNTAESNPKQPAATKGLISYGSDDDDDEDASTSQNFFSLDSAKEADSVTSTNDLKEPAVRLKPSDKESAVSTNTETEAERPSSPTPEVIVRPEPGLTNDSPLDFANAGRFSSWSSASSSYLGGWRPSYPNQRSGGNYVSFPCPSTAAHQSSVQYNMVDVDSSQSTPGDSPSEMPPDDLQQVINDREFQRLQGKRKRGMDETINFVDAKVDDYVDPSELSKYITEESEYTSAKNKDDMPTSQQKRKKQITYLAFQAKEKEMELKNTWSQNRSTKRQTQAKYGF